MHPEQAFFGCSSQTHTTFFPRMDDRGRIHARNAITTCRFALGRRRLLSSSSSLRTPNLHEVHRSSGGQGAAELKTLNMTRKVETKREKGHCFGCRRRRPDCVTSPSLCYEYLQCKDDPNGVVRFSRTCERALIDSSKSKHGTERNQPNHSSRDET